MKVKKEHFNHIMESFEKLVVEQPENCKAHANSGLSEKRIVWDFARAAGLTSFICDDLYKYCNDTHIETALKYAYRNLWL